MKTKSVSGINSANKEAMRYVENAVEILKTKAGKKDKFYSDAKYVKMAGNTLWNGVLLAMDYKFPEVKKKSKTRPDVHDYRAELAKVNQKILKYFNTTYGEAHLQMGYDGDLNYTIAKDAVENSQVIINWATA